MGRKAGALGWVHVVALLCASAATLATFSARHGGLRELPVPSSGQELGSEQAAPARLASSESSLKLVSRTLYPYSVIPGGVRSPQELKSAMLRDPVVASHYGDFDLAKARVIRVDRERAMYVSYRLADRVYWTKKPLKISKGETVVSDGVHEARTRCGNRVSYIPAEPVSPLEPPARILETPEAPILVAVNEPPVEIPVSPPAPPVTPVTPTPPGGGIIPPVYYPPIGGGTPTHPPITPPIKTPEPATPVLLAIGLLSLLAVGRVSWIRNKQ